MGRSDGHPLPELSERQSEILQAVVEDYIETAEPVGSRTLTKRNTKIDLSPASVRNLMSDLEDLGYLSAPHASAGRVPTALAFRVYVERLASRGRLSPRDREVISAVVAPVDGSRELSSILVDASRALSSLSNQASLILFPRLDSVVFSHIELVPIRERTVLVIFVAKSGLIQQRVIDIDVAIDRDELRRMSNYLNSLLDGKSLVEVRETIVREMHDERARADEMMRTALTLCDRTVSMATASASTLMIEGERNFLEHPEFSDVGKMRKIFRAFEEKTLILRMLDAAAARPSEQRGQEGAEGAVYFGADGNVRELKDLAAVMASYSSEGGPEGQVGVVGPMRMDYSRVIPLVELTATTLSRSLGQSSAEVTSAEGSGGDASGEGPDRKR